MRRLLTIAVSLGAIGSAQAQYLKGGVIDNAIHSQPVNPRQSNAIAVLAVVETSSKKCHYRLFKPVLDDMLRSAGVDLSKPAQKFAYDNSSIAVESYSQQHADFCATSFQSYGSAGSVYTGLLMNQ